MNFDTLFVNWAGRTARNQYIGALITVLAALAFYYFRVPGRNSEWVQLVFLYPAAVLVARRLHDMGRTGWLMLVPAALTVVAMGIWAKRITLGTQLDIVVPLAALVVFLGFALWGCIARGQAETNTFGPPVAA